ncbi:MAG: DoxX family protein [Bacteroidota bacterium]
MKYLVYLSRILVGSLFIVSGLIKANDPKGFSYKLEEYFAESALNWPALEPYALVLAILVCYGEIILGFALLFGARFKLTTITLAVLCLFFLWLTDYTADCLEDGPGTYMKLVDGVEQEFEKTCVDDCGCFGDAMKGSIGRSLTPKESFYKDLIALIALAPSLLWLLFGAGKEYFKLNGPKADLVLFIGSLIGVAIWSWIFSWMFPIWFTLAGWAIYWLIKKYLGQEVKHEWIMAAGITLMALIFIWRVTTDLPLRDYRPYAEGNNLKELRKSAEELNLDPPVYATEYTFTNSQNGKDTIVLSTDWLKIYKEPWFKKYEKKSFNGKSVLVKLGYEPLIPPDFAFESIENGEITEDILNDARASFLFITYDVEKADKKASQSFATLATAIQNKGLPIYGATSSDLTGAAEDYRHEYQMGFEFLQGDEKVLKTIVRSNPGVVLLKDGVVLKKWSSASIPSSEELAEYDIGF